MFFLSLNQRINQAGRRLFGEFQRHEVAVKILINPGRDHFKARLAPSDLGHGAK